MEQYEIDEMRKVLGKKLLLRQLRPRGIGSIIFGAIALVVGGIGITVNPINGVLAALGVFLIVEGIWLLAAPSPQGFIVDGCALIALGVWNILVTIQNMSADSGAAPHFGVLGLIQLAWGIQSFGNFKRASEMLSVTTSQDAINRVDALVNTVTKSNSKSNPGYFEVRQQNFLTDQYWKGILLDDIAVLAAVRTHEGIIASRDDFSLTLRGKRPAGKHPIGKAITATLVAGGKKMPVQIKAASLERLQAWKPDVIPEAPAY